MWLFPSDDMGDSGGIPVTLGRGARVVTANSRPGVSEMIYEMIFGQSLSSPYVGEGRGRASPFYSLRYYPYVTSREYTKRHI
jgi:hypothetical protein